MNADDQRIEFRRIHQAPIDLVFDCLTTPAHLAHFWGPDGCTTPEESIVVDLQPGGNFHLDMVFGGGAYIAPMRARYDVIERPHRLGWTETENGMRSEVELNDLGDGTTEVVTILIDPPEGFADTEGQRGFETSLDRMVAYTRQAAGHDGT